MSFFEDTPLIASGNSDIDGFGTILWVAVILFAVIDIAYHYIRAIVDLKVEEKKTRRRRNVPIYKIGTFLVLALVAVVVVNALRFEHRKLKLASWAQIEHAVLGKEPTNPLVKTGMEFTDKVTHGVHVDVSGVNMLTMDDGKKAMKGAWKGAVNMVKKAPSPGEVLESAEDTVDSATNAVKNAVPNKNEVKKGAKTAVKKTGSAVVHGAEKVAEVVVEDLRMVPGWAKNASKWLIEGKTIPNEHAYTFPWGWFGPKKEMAMWDFFKTLVDEARHFWWTQQWLSGYLAWAVFVGIESRSRQLPAFAFIVIGYCFSLAASQSLYYALLLLKPSPPQPRKQSWMVPHLAVAFLPILLEMMGLATLRKAYFRIESDTNTMYLPLSATAFFNVLQGFVVALPAIIAIAIRDYLPHSWCTWRLSSADAKAYLVLLWYAISLLALTLHISSTVQAFQETWKVVPRLFLPFEYIGLGPPIGSKSTGKGLWAVLKELGSHDWLAALAWDVVFSFVGLCAWAIMSSADLNAMVKCSLWPWLDETISAVQEGAEVVQETAEPYLDAMQESVEQLQETAEPYAKDVRKRATRVMKTTEPYLETAQDYVDDGLDQAAKYAKNAANLAAAQLGYQPVETEERGRKDTDEDAEWTEVQRKGRGASPRKKGRPAKAKRSPSQSPAPPSRQSSSRAQASPAKRRSSRIKKLGSSDVRTDGAEQNSDEEDDKSTEPWYRRVSLPSSSDIRVPHGFAEGAEASGLTFGLFLVGGLGLASSSVYGAHETRDEDY